MEILVLKTNIELHDLPKIKRQFDQLPTVQKWTIDFDDCDHILRIESLTQSVLPIIIKKISALGLICTDLEY